MDRGSEKHRKIVRNRRIAVCSAVILSLLFLSLVFFGVLYAAGFLKKGPGEPEPESTAVKETEELPTGETTEEEDTVEIWKAGLEEAAAKEETVSEQKEAEADGTVDVKEQFEELLSGNDRNVNALEIEERLSKLSLEEKVAQLFFVSPEAITGADTVTMAGDKTKSAIEKYHVGGIIYFSKNLLDPDQTRSLLENTAEYAKQGNGIPLFLGVDEEGGSITRLASNEAFGLENTDSAGKTGSTGDRENAYKAGKHIGSYLKEYGFNLNFAPVADVDSLDSAIGDRSFGSDPDSVSEMAESFEKGLNEEGIMACYKHFPGFGRSKKNTDFATVSLDVGTEELKETDLIPFINASGSGERMIMAGHMAFPAITGDDTPASMSPLLITDYLKKELSFGGVVITDALNAKAITDRYDSTQAAVNALKAGADMLLMPADFEAAYNGVLNAVETGELTEDVIDRAAGRILNLKSRFFGSPEITGE